MPRRDEEPDDSAPAASDPQTALLDSAWALLDQGDLDGARAASAAAVALDASCSEAATLEGAIAAASGDVDAALAAFDRAIELDPEAVDPYLHAAELHVYALGEFEDAIELCDAALEVADEEEDYLDALLLKAEAQLELGQEEAARKTLRDLPPAPARLPDASLELRAGSCLLDAKQLDAAERHLRAALEMDPASTDARYMLGVLHGERGDREQMARLFLEVRERDLEEIAGSAPPWRVTPERFEALAQQALAELPEDLRRRLANVPVIAADYPAVELCAEGADPRMMGFFAGTPYPEHSAVGGVPHLECIYLYQHNIERACHGLEEMEAEIRTTLIHETGHFFGLSEEQLEALDLD